MDWIVELIKNAPAIIEAASRGDLALAAFFMLVGSLLIVYMLRDGPIAWRFGAVIAWLLVCLIALLVVTGSKTNYRAALEGTKTVLGKAFSLDLGHIETGAILEVPINLGIERGSARMRLDTAEPPLGARWASGSTVEQLQDGLFSKLIISVKAGESAARSSHRIRLVPDGPGFGGAPLDIAVVFQPSAPAVPIAKSSGPQNSGNGQDSSTPYTVCADVPADGRYVVDAATVRYSLTGDRACNAYSTCQTRIDEKSACLIFTLQGHNECGPCASIRQSEGHIDGVARLQRDMPSLSADQS
jgi:hypothetical protein